MNTPANINTQAAHNNDQDTLVLGDLARLVIEQIWWVLGITLVVVLLAVAYVTVAKPTYSADALIQVEQPDSTSSPLTSSASALSGLSGQTLPTAAEIEVLQSRDVMGPVVHRFHMEYSIAAHTFPILGSIAHHFAKPGELTRPWLGMSSYGWGGEDAVIGNIVVPASLENKELTLTALGGNQYELRDPDGDLMVRGTVGQQQQTPTVQIKVDKLLANPGTKFTVVRANELDAISGLAADVKVAELGKQTGVIQMVMMGTSPTQITSLVNAIADSYLEQHLARRQEEASRQLTFLDGELPHLKAQLEAAEARLSAFQQKSGTFKPSEEAQIYLQGAIEYERQIAGLRLQETQLLQRYTRDHPAVQAVEQQIAQTTTEMNSFQARFRSIPTNEANALSLQRDAKVSEEIYVLLLNKVQELQLTRAGTVGNVRILDRSLRPAIPIKPKKGLVIGASVFLGLILGVLFVFIRKTVTVGIEDPNDIERKFGLPVMGAIPLNPVQVRWDDSFKKDKGIRRPILASAMPHDPSIEALRSFRTSLQFALADAPNKLLSFSGPAPGTGKSFISINLATILAEAGQRVLLVDADMRRGHLNEYFSKPRFPGLSEVLAGDVPAAQVINTTDIANLWTIWSGAIPDRPSELLTAPSTRTMFASLEKDFDVVIIDTPPVLAVTDATIISGFAGSSFMVLRSGMHSDREIEEAIKRLSQSGGRLVGSIFNALPSRLAKRGRYSGGNYHYVYNYDAER